MPAGYIDPESGQYIYGTDDAYTDVAIADVLNRGQDAARIAAAQDRARIGTLESLVGSAYGAAQLSADVTAGPGDATVPFNQTALAAGIDRTGSGLYPQTAGVYLATFGFSGLPSSANTFRNVWLERFVAGAWERIPLTTTQCAMGPSGTGQFANATVPVALGAGEGVRMRTNGSSGAPTVTVSAAATYLSLVKVSG